MYSNNLKVFQGKRERERHQHHIGMMREVRSIVSYVVPGFCQVSFDAFAANWLEIGALKGGEREVCFELEKWMAQ